ncbi:MAG: FMN-binding glutamate synthase family protein [Sulfurimonadaceae bacterium]|nr:FMN-binding glutamate synthase family protein [Sulfurimonadaceae bacterium]
MLMGIVIFLVVVVIFFYIYDKYIQREHQLLTNYPIIGRFRYVFEEFREPLRQYFGDEKFYESKDKLDWVYKASKDLPNYASFSPAQPLPKPKFLLKHTNIVLNDDEVSDDFSITIGDSRAKPYHSKSIIVRSAMSDGAISPEGTRAFVKGSYRGGFAINSGEGSITTNFFITHKSYTDEYMSIIKVPKTRASTYKTIDKYLGGYLAIKYLRKVMFNGAEVAQTYFLDQDKMQFYRPNWDVPLESFPQDVPSDMPDIIWQISSSLNGCRTKDGKFDPLRYQKVMRFCRMSEIKLAQGAKQTGGKLTANKVTESIAYYRGIEAHKDMFAPNRFPYASSVEELYDFIGQLQELSDKPVGIKIVVSTYDSVAPFAKEIKKRLDSGDSRYPDYIAIDGGSGGSATAPLDMMERIGLNIKDSIYLADKVLREHGVRDRVKLSASGKILTPDDVVITLAIGADFVQIGRGFMMSAGCIRARYCSGSTGRACPVGLATQDEGKRAGYLVYKYADYVKNYHNNILKGIQSLLAVMGLKHYKELSKDNLLFIDRDNRVHDDIEKIFEENLDLKGKEIA